MPKYQLKTRPESELYVILEDMDFSWTREEIKAVKQMWADGDHLALIAGRLERDPDEIALLLMDLARKNLITKRRRGVYSA